MDEKRHRKKGKRRGRRRVSFTTIWNNSCTMLPITIIGESVSIPRNILLNTERRAQNNEPTTAVPEIRVSGCKTKKPCVLSSSHPFSCLTACKLIESPSDTGQANLQSNS